uniref:Sigma intracellular receptor 2 n=1 Tax=Arion vulgaris TaxID=1028688 RepID=A0A0B6ZSX5_9EUPU
MVPGQHRTIDYIFFGYFLFQIPSTLFMDTQAVYSKWLYPSWMKAIPYYYMENYRDPFLANAWKHPWYLSFCLLEHYFGIPFFFWATKSYYYGALTRPRIIIPAVIYSSHTITVILAVWTTTLIADFSKYEELAPRTFNERLILCSAYAPFFIISLVLLIDSIKLSWKQKCN